MGFVIVYLFFSIILLYRFFGFLRINTFNRIKSTHGIDAVARMKECNQYSVLYYLRTSDKLPASHARSKPLKST